MTNEIDLQLFFTDLDHYKEVNDVYGQYFPSKPARTAVQVAKLPLGVPLEMEVVALA